MSPTLHQALSLIADYQRLYRAPHLTPFEISGLYDLLPADSPDIKENLAWPAEWPNSRRRGIYLILAATGELLYVGKASMSHTLGARLGSYFSRGSTGECSANGDWSCAPKYVVTVCPPDTSAFESGALEEFLIAELNPSHNTVGKRKNAV